MENNSHGRLSIIHSICCSLLPLWERFGLWSMGVVLVVGTNCMHGSISFGPYFWADGFPADCAIDGLAVHLASFTLMH